MPGKFIEEIRIFRCGTHSDGTAIFCSELGWAKIPFLLLENEESTNVGWQEANATDVHVPLKRLISALGKYGIRVSYDEKDLALRLGSPGSSESPLEKS